MPFFCLFLCFVLNIIFFFFIKGNIEGTNSKKIVFNACAYIYIYVLLCLTCFEMFHVKTDFYPNCLALAVNNSWQRVKKQVVYLCLLGQSEVVRRYLPFNLYNQVISGYSQKWSWGYLSIDFYNQKWSGSYLTIDLYSQVIGGYLYSLKRSGRYLSFDLYSQVIGGYLSLIHI